MSAYRTEWLTTYVGGPLLVVIGVLLPIVPFVVDRPDDVRYGLIGPSVFFAMVFIVIGIRVTRDSHWWLHHPPHRKKGSP